MGAFHIVSRIPYFRDFPRTDLEGLAGRARFWHGGPGAVLFAEGEPAAGLYYVVEGRVEVVRHSPEGRRLVVREFEPGETFNEVGALDGGVNVATAVAAAPDTMVLLIPGEFVRDLSVRHASLSYEMMQEMARKLRFAMTRVGRLGLMDVKARLSAWLLEAADKDGAVRGLSQEQLAERLGTVRQVVGRALGELRDEGVVEVGRGVIRILDAGALRDHAH